MVAVRHPDQDDLVRVFVKGAPEYIIQKCSSTIGIDGGVIPLQDEQFNYIMSDVISKEFTIKGLRVLAFAFKDMHYDEFQALKEECNNFVEEVDKEELERNLTFVGAFALQDDLRDKVVRSIQFAQKGHIQVRMVSGDNIETATAVAIKAGILSEEESRQKYAVMQAEEFRKLVGGMKKTVDADG